METFPDRFRPFLKKMKKEGAPDSSVAGFKRLYEKLTNKENGCLSETDIHPVAVLPDMDALTHEMDLEKTGRQYMAHTAVIKLNGGLGTGMGLRKAKSLIQVKSNLSFMDIVLRQIRQSETRMPLVFMNSFATRKDTLKVLENYPWMKTQCVDVDFVQHKVPKVDAATYRPAGHPANPRLEWCPPGHGNIYTALMDSGILDQLLENGYQYAFISNIDNLGAIVDPLILGYFIQNGFDFMMETADRTDDDKKGGHLARTDTGKFILREVAQCSDEDRSAFEDIERHRYFNTNNIWIYLPELKKMLLRNKGILDLPLIRNKKNLDPRDPDSPVVYQLETAMGGAISVFRRAGAVRVPRTRFVPVKNTNDLLAVRSDRYKLNESYQIVPNPEQKTDRIHIDLDPGHYKFLDDFEKRFPKGPPSLVDCSRLAIYGDFIFGWKIKVGGESLFLNPTDKPVNLKSHQQLDSCTMVVTDKVRAAGPDQRHEYGDPA